MDQELDATIEIPPGCTATRTILGVPTEAALAMLCLAAIPYLAFRTVWVFLILPPLWGFLKYQGRKDPAFLGVWAGQMQFAPYYHG